MYNFISSSYVWESDAIFELIDMYRDRPMLWDVEHDNYRHRLKKSLAWKEIADHFGVAQPVVEHKIKILTSQFRREVNRCLKKGEVSKWYAFKRLSFLKVGNAALMQNRNESEEESDKSAGEDSSTIKAAMSNDINTTPEPSPSTSNTAPPIVNISATNERSPSQELSRPHHVHRILPRYDTDEVLKKRKRCEHYCMNKMLKIIAKDIKPRDEFSVYAEYVANKLRNINNLRARNSAQFHINNILFNAEMGKYDGETPNRGTDDDKDVSQVEQPARPAAVSSRIEHSEEQLNTNALDGSPQIQIKEEFDSF